MVKLENTGERPYQMLDPGQTPPRLVVIRPGDAREVSDEGAAIALREGRDLKKVGAAKGGAS